MNFHIITLFPEMCKAYTDASVLGRAQKTEKANEQTSEATIENLLADSFLP